MNPNDTSENAYSTPPIITVSALNQAVARTLERTFPLTWIAGEISNFTRAASGHWYFTLKDAGAQVRAVMFRGRAQYAGLTPRDGDKVEVRALVTLYAPRGDYQLSVESIRRSGVGNLYEAFLALKEKLSAEGVFDPARKRPIPVFAKTVGIVTSPQAAALRDILTALQRRAPHVRIVIYPAPVQGAGAGQKIAQAIATAAARAECDVLLVCRGGGSIEDLWSFNEEVVARTIAACEIPIIVGVGHETDFTIADFVADVRAPTPTAAAEMAATARMDWIATVDIHRQDLTRALHRTLSNNAQALDWLARRLVSPVAYIAHERLKLQGLQNRLKHATAMPAAQARYTLSHLRMRLSAQLPDTRSHRLQLIDCTRRINSRIATDIAHRRHALNSLAAQLGQLSPQRTLERGYAIIVDQRNEIVRNPHQLKAGQQLAIQLAEGAADVGVASVQTKLGGI